MLVLEKSIIIIILKFKYSLSGFCPLSLLLRGKMPNTLASIYLTGQDETKVSQILVPLLSYCTILSYCTMECVKELSQIFVCDKKYQI